MKKISILFFVLISTLNVCAQQELQNHNLEPYTTYFTLSNHHIVDEKGTQAINKIIGSAQFVGLAEVHQSQQLSFFTIGLLEILHKKGFNNFALEIGPFSAKVIDSLSQEPVKTRDNLKSLNWLYGEKGIYKKPIFFTDKVEDATFIEKAAKLDYNFWGLDQEYDYSYLMHLDIIYKATDKNAQINVLYKQARQVLEKNIFKNKIKGKTRNCWFQKNNSLNNFLDAAAQQNAAIDSCVKHLRYSWDIYCKEETGSAGQYRANYMKAVFDNYYNSKSAKDGLPKVFLKLGGVHLTKGKSYFKVNDIGKHVYEKAMNNDTKFISIRHLTRYKNNRDLTGKKGWNLPSLQRMGKKDKWTIINLQPLREKLKRGEINPTKAEMWEINNYDVVVIPPNDKNATSNY